MTDKLKVYNSSLRALGERELASLTENREPRRILDAVWADGFVDSVLEQGFWKFATKTVRLDYAPSITPDFGLSRAFEKDTDFIRTIAICSDEFFQTPLLEFADEADLWYANIDTIYVKYVSNAADYGGDLSKWPETFSTYAWTNLAANISTRITASDAKTDMLEKKARKLLIDARSKDAVAGPTQFMPPGRWASSRRRNISYTNRFDTSGAF